MFLISNRLYLNLYRTHVNLCLVNLLPQIGKFFSGERKIIRLKLKNRSAENDLSSSVRA